MTDLTPPTPTPHDIFKAAIAAATAKRDAACAIAYEEHNLALIAADTVLRADLYGKESK